MRKTTGMKQEMKQTKVYHRCSSQQVIKQLRQQMGKKYLYDMFFVYLAPEQEIIFGHGTRKHY